MSSNTDGPGRVNVQEIPGRPPGVNRGRRTAASGQSSTPNIPIAPKKQKTSRQQRAQARADKALEFRASLPVWLRDNEPTNRQSDEWLHWSAYARIIGGKDESGRESWLPVPQLIDFDAKIIENNAFNKAHARDSQAVVCVISGGGGESKSSTALLLATDVSEVAKVSTLAYDGDISNPRVFDLLHLEKDGAMTTHDVARRIRLVDWNPSHDEIIQLIAQDDESNVFALHTLQESIADRMTFDSLKRLKKAFHTVVVDTLPGSVDGDTGRQGIVNAASIVVVTADGSSSKGISSINASLNWRPNNLRNEDGSVKDHVIIVVTKLAKADFNLKRQYLLAKEFNASQDQVVLFPFSNYIRGSGRINQTSKIQRSAFDKRMSYSMSQLHRVKTETAIKLNRDDAATRTTPASKSEVHSSNGIGPHGLVPLQPVVD